MKQQLGTQTRNVSSLSAIRSGQPGIRSSGQVRGRNAALWERYWCHRDVESRNHLVLEYEPLVYRVARRFLLRESRAAADLLQVGRLGLISAVERYDPQFGTSFVTFAVPTIGGCIKHHLRDHSWVIRPPRRIRELGMRLRSVGAGLEAALGRPALPQEIACAAGLPEERVLEALEVDHLPAFVSLEAAASADGATPFVDPGFLSPEFAAVDLRETLVAALAQLTDRQRAILRLRFHHELPQSEVGRRLGISQMHVSRLERKAMRALRDFLKA